jgi:WD40 repeat protein
MARICRYCREVAVALAVIAGLFPAPAFAEDPGRTAETDLYDRPALSVDPGMHTAPIWSLAVDHDGRFAVTGGGDRSVRIWSIADRKLMRTIWIPAGPDPVGAIYAVAISPDGSTVAAGGYTERIGGNHSIYLFSRDSGAMIRRIDNDASSAVLFLSFSSNGRYLAATFGTGGLRIFDGEKQWGEAGRDDHCGARSAGVAFSPDGRLITTCYDGTLRLYDSSFRPVGDPVKAPGGNRPRGIAFSPDGKTLALGYNDVARIDLLDGASLGPVRALTPTNLRLNDAGLETIAWSRDGGTLFAVGDVSDGNRDPQSDVLLAWDQAGLGKERRLAYCANDSGTGLSSLPDGSILVTSTRPCIGLIDSGGKDVWTVLSPLVDFIDQADTLKTSVDGKVVDFAFNASSRHRAYRFDVRTLHLGAAAEGDGTTFPPNRIGVSIDGWRDGADPTLGGVRIPIDANDIARSYSVSVDTKRFFVASSHGLAAFDTAVKKKWTWPSRSEVWAVNASRDGRIVVAAHGDGTIRWRRADDGRELLALQLLPHNTDANDIDWVLWTPEGLYEATPGAHDVLKWVTNHGPDMLATAFPASATAKMHRPDLLAHVLDQSESSALRVKDISDARLEVQAKTGSAKPPGGVLHVLAIGVDTFGLHYAADDARAVVKALSESQKIGTGKASLYGEVVPVPLLNEQASGTAILEAVDDLIRSMRKSVADQDVAVILFSGHGEIIEDKYYLIPYGVDISTPIRMERSSVWIEELADKIKELVKRGRVLLLLDACHSGAVGPGGVSPVLDAKVLRDALNSDNMAVLTSSDKKDELSREDINWGGHGAFTKAFLDALAGGADPNRRGMISPADLTVAMRNELERLSGQHLGMHVNFADDVFVTGQ